MKRVHEKTFKDLRGWAGDEEIAQMIIEDLERKRLRKPSNLYRGVAADIEKYALIKRTGNDRTETLQESHVSQELLILEYTGKEYIGKKELIEQCSPRRIWAATEEELDRRKGNTLVRAVSFARDETTDSEPISVVTVYNGELLTRVTNAFESGDELFEFNPGINPREALIALYRWEEKAKQ